MWCGRSGCLTAVVAHLTYPTFLIPFSLWLMVISNHHASWKVRLIDGTPALQAMSNRLAAPLSHLSAGISLSRYHGMFIYPGVSVINRD
jgi:hypothetical protein